MDLKKKRQHLAHDVGAKGYDSEDFDEDFNNAKLETKKNNDKERYSNKAKVKIPIESPLDDMTALSVFVGCAGFSSYTKPDGYISQGKPNLGKNLLNNPHNEWIIDSGASKHMTHHVDFFHKKNIT